MRLLFVYLLASAGTTFAQTSNTGWVVIPLSEYGTLRGRAFPVDRGIPGPAVEATLTRMEELDRRWTCAACGRRIWHKGSPEAARCKCGKSAFPPLPAG